MDTVTAYQCYPDENTPVETEGNREEILELQDSIDRSTASIELDQKQIEMATESLMNAAEGSEDYDFYMEYLSELQTSLDTSKNNIVDWTNQKLNWKKIYTSTLRKILQNTASLPRIWSFKIAGSCGK